MPLIDVVGAPRINLVRAGRRGGAPIVFLHPVGLDLTWWDNQFAELQTDFDLAAFDMPGHGSSGALEAPPTFDTLNAVLDGVVSSLDAGPVHLVGLSVGGMIAQTIALSRPDRVRSLSLVGTLCTFPDAVRAALRERARVARADGMARIAALANERWFPAAFRNRRPDVLDRASKSLMRQDPHFHASMWEMIAALDLAAHLHKIACPTMVVVGAEDINAPVAAAHEIANLIGRGTTTHELAGVGHFPPTEAPTQFNELLRSLLLRN